MTPETKLVSAMVDAGVDYLAEQGELNGRLQAALTLKRAARRVVWAAHYYGNNSALFKDAVVDLEAITGLPEREIDI